MGGSYLQETYRRVAPIWRGFSNLRRGGLQPRAVGSIHAMTSFHPRSYINIGLPVLLTSTFFSCPLLKSQRLESEGHVPNVRRRYPVPLQDPLSLA